MTDDMKFSELPIEQQAKHLMEYLEIKPGDKGATEQEWIDEIVEYIILPVLREKGRLS